MSLILNLQTGKEKLGISNEEEVKVFTDDDRTEVDEDVFLEFDPATIYIMISSKDTPEVNEEQSGSVEGMIYLP